MIFLRRAQQQQWQVHILKEATSFLKNSPSRIVEEQVESEWQVTVTFFIVR